MHMYFFKILKITYSNYFKIYDVKGRLLKISFILLLLLLLNSIFEPAPKDYFLFLSQGNILHGVDIKYDYIIPTISSLIIACAFFYDYKNNIYELISFYNSYKFNYIVFIRWAIYTAIFVFGSFFTGLIYYRKISFLDTTNIFLTLRFLPNILLLNSLMLIIITITKNIYAGIFLTVSYSLCDYLSSGHLFKIFSIGATSNNFYYTISPKYYILNRIILIVFSILAIYTAGRLSS